ncbi:MAG: hypothetical protein AB7G12_16070 [Thermoanaerobaculia bacterium]
MSREVEDCNEGTARAKGTNRRGSLAQIPGIALLAKRSDAELIQLRAALDLEMRRRRVAYSVGAVGERLVVEYFRVTPGLPKLQHAPAGTKNVDALSRTGDRYSIKTICNAKKTGTVYPDGATPSKQLFEFLLLARLADDWSLAAIYQFSWEQFVALRSWDKRMNAWYVAVSSRTLSAATTVFFREVASAQ